MRLAFLSIVVLLITAACGADEGTPPASATAPAVATTPVAGQATATATTTTIPATTAAADAEAEASPTVTAETQSGVRGVVSAYSDVGSQPDEPLAEQTVVILPLEAADAVLGSSASPSPDELRFLKTTLPEPDGRVTLSVTDADGHYEAALAPGEHVLCLADPAVDPAADSAGPSPTDYPLSVRGCGAFIVPPGATVEVNVSSGFGEILLETG